MARTLLVALRTTAVSFVLTGLAYPLALTGIAQLLFPYRANGSLVRDERGQLVGSELIGQAFENPAYFQPRPSAAGNGGFDATSSGGSNLGPTSAKLRERATAEAARLATENPDAPGPVPGELVTTSASGLDPHLSPEAARWQIPRVARARSLDPSRVRGVVDALVEGRDLGFLGEPRVNVLRLNLALDRQFGRPEGMAAAK
ncbi:MAG TPA: potassium-transporting ATPase subunit KdpC [Myxococcota bacterium]|nr:potassium-transporting ATPase subunit KdpC [Myxococcota bacterium]